VTVWCSERGRGLNGCRQRWRRTAKPTDRRFGFVVRHDHLQLRYSK